MIILSLDPSGNFNEGKGTTGYAVMDAITGKLLEVDVIAAQSAECIEEYWEKHILLLDKLYRHYNGCMVVRCEDYLLYKHKAMDQVQSHFETPQLIGILKYWCFANRVTIYMRPASTVKNRWTDELLERKGYIEKKSSSWYPVGCNQHNLTLHERDAIRHAVACYYFDIERNEEYDNTIKRP